MATHPCPRCGVLIPVGVQYCARCKPLAEAQAEEAIRRKAEYRKAKYNKAYNKKRDPGYLSFYRSKDWKTMSKAYLQQAGYRCEAKLEGCTHLAVEVHHKKAIQTPDGWDHRLDWSNLEAVCTQCHNARHHKNFKRKKDDGVIDLRTMR